MKLLLDQKLPRQLLVDLLATFQGSVHVQAVGLERSSDEFIWTYACSNEFHVVTKDADFAESTVLRGYPPKVIWLNCGNTDNVALRRRMQVHLAEIQRFLSADGEGVLELE